MAVETYFFSVITLGQDLFSGPILTSLLIYGDVNFLVI